MNKRTLPAKNDNLIAFKVLSLAPDLSRAAARIGSILLEHFNRSTGRCDPSVRRLAQLSGLNKSTVKKATSDLCEAGWFDKQSHGGVHNTCSYQPNWEAFTSFEIEWRECFDSDSKVRKNRPSESKNLDNKGLKNQTQTNLKTNPINQTEDCALDSPTKKAPAVHELNQSPTSTNAKHRKELMNVGLNLDTQRSILFPLNGGRQPNRRDVVSNNPDQRTSQLLEMHPQLWTIEGLPERISTAERLKPGSGEAIVRDAVRGLVEPIAVGSLS